MLLLTKGKPTWQLLKYKYKVLINLDPRKEKKEGGTLSALLSLSLAIMKLGYKL